MIWIILYWIIKIIIWLLLGLSIVSGLAILVYAIVSDIKARKIDKTAQLIGLVLSIPLIFGLMVGVGYMYEKAEQFNTIQNEVKR